MKKQYRATYPSDIKNVAVARLGIAEFAAECGFPNDTISDIRLAAGEALSNAVEHGSMKPGRKITVVCVFDGVELSIEVRDRGIGFAEPSDRSNVQPGHRARGFGIFLMRRLMDEVSFARNGTVVRLVRRHPQPN